MFSAGRDTPPKGVPPCAGPRARAHRCLHDAELVLLLGPGGSSAEWRGAEHWLTRVLQPWLSAGRQRFRREMESSRTIEFEADHHLFNSHPDRTLREISGFLLSTAAP
jgi:hypothetical protein